jgi:thiol-disulfide isomerase/thioredoxin
MRRPTVIALAFCLTLGLALQGRLGAEDIRWRTDVANARTESEASGKPLLLHFTADWCRPCQELKRFVLSSEQLACVVNQELIPVLVELDNQAHLVREYGITQIPCDVFLATDGKLLLKCQSGQTTDAWLRTIERAVESHQAIASAGPEGQRARKELDELHREWESRRAEAERAATSNSSGESPFQLEAFHMQSHFASTHPPRANPSQPSASAGSSASVGPAPLQTPSGERIVNQMVSGNAPSGVAQLPRPSGPLANAGSLSAAPKSQTIGNPWVAEERALSPLSPMPPAARSMEHPAEVCLDGLCPVTLIAENRVSRGDPALGCVHRGRVYFFVDEAKRQRFLADPDRWSPLLAGFDPVRFAREGTLVPGLRKHGVFMASGQNQAIVLFDSDASRQEFQTNPQEFLAAIEAATTRASQAMR